MTLPPFPWIYPYFEDVDSNDRYPAHTGRSVLRPIVNVSLLGMEQMAPALVDSGSEHTLVAPWVARAAGLDRNSAAFQVAIGIGGDTIQVGLVPATLRLHTPDESMDDYVEWETEIGVVDRWKPSWSVLLGQIGFLDRWTVTMQRSANTLVVEEWDAFDKRFGVRIEEAEEKRIRKS